MINGTEYSILRADQDGIQLADGTVFACDLQWTKAGNEAVAYRKGLRWPVQRLGAEQASAVSDEKLCHSPMNGQVTKIYCGVGTPVEKDQVVLVLEAMKMENEIAAPRAGTIKTLAPAVGSVVSQGDLLFEIEDSP